MANPIELLKDFSQLLKKFNDRELMQKIVDLQTAVMEQQQENFRLSQELGAAREQLELKNKLKLKQFGDVHYYVFEGEDIPYCPVCYGKNKERIPLPAGQEWNGGFRRICSSCNKMFYEKQCKGPVCQWLEEGEMLLCQSRSSRTCLRYRTTKAGGANRTVLDPRATALVKAFLKPVTLSIAPGNAVTSFLVNSYASGADSFLQLRKLA